MNWARQMSLSCGTPDCPCGSAWRGDPGDKELPGQPLSLLGCSSTQLFLPLGTCIPPSAGAGKGGPRLQGLRDPGSCRWPGMGQS